MDRGIRLLRLALALAVLAGCTGSSGTPAGPGPAGPAPAATGSGRSLTDGTTPFVRRCQNEAEGEWGGELAKDWRRSSVIVGPLAFVALREYASTPAGDYAPRGDRFPALKVLAVLERGQTVTVAVAADQRPHAALIYDASRWTADGYLPLRAGDPAITFVACKVGDTQFNGGSWSTAPAAWTLRCGSPLPRARGLSGSPPERAAAERLAHAGEFVDESCGCKPPC
jgi:hypothetical protein